MTLHLHPLTPALAPHFDRLNRAWILEFFTLEAPDEAILAAPQTIVEGGGAVLFATLEGEVVGTGALLNLGDGVGEIVKMAVDPSVQGRGIGRALLEGLVAAARATGFHTLQIETSSRLPGAIHLYRKLGFVDHAATGSAHGFTRSDVFLELKL